MLCVDYLYIYFPLISQIIIGVYFPQISLIITGVYFPLISQIITDLNNILSFTPYTLRLPPLSVSIRAIRGSYIPFLYTLHPTPSTTICVHPCYPWELYPFPLHLTPYTLHHFPCLSVGVIVPLQQKYYPCRTIHTISDKGTIFRAHMQGVGYENTKFCCFSSKCLHMCKIFCTFVAEMHISAVDYVGYYEDNYCQ